MYRIVKETNLLSGRTEWIIERRKKFLWFESWTRDLELNTEYSGKVGAPSLEGAQYKLSVIEKSNGNIIERENVAG